MLLEAALFCVAGAALGASLARFVWQAQHSEHLHIEVGWSLATRDAFRRHLFAWLAQHLEHLRLVLRGRLSTWGTSGSFCVADGATHHIYTSPSTHHRLHSIINTSSSTQHHQHCTISTTSSNITPSTQHHQHHTIYTTSSHTGRCSTWSTAILPLLPHSC